MLPGLLGTGTKTRNCLVLPFFTPLRRDPPGSARAAAAGRGSLVGGSAEEGPHGLQGLSASAKELHL